jgi:single stranded DNA-binding protein
MQQITLLGNIGRDAVIRDTNGRKAIGFSVAVNESYKDAQGTKVENTTWYNCTIWRDGQQSNRIADYLKAGQQVLVQGQPKPRVYQSQEVAPLPGPYPAPLPARSRWPNRLKHCRATAMPAPRRWLPPR